MFSNGAVPLSFHEPANFSGQHDSGHQIDGEQLVYFRSNGQ